MKIKKNYHFQARKVSVDGKMVDERLITMSQDVSAGKSANAVMQLQGGELPPFETNF